MKRRQIVVGVLCGLLVVGAAVFGGISYHNGQQDSVSAEETDAEEMKKAVEAFALSKSKDEEDEDGMIYIQAEADGTVKAEDADEDYPITVKVRYYLDDKELSPSEMVGKSGKVRIRFEYENRVTETVKVDGEEMTVHPPFMMISAVMLPTDTFSHVEISDGKIIESSDQNIAVGMAFPGLKDELNLDNIEEAEDIDLPDYVEITADASEFELEFTANISASIGLEDIESGDLDDIDDLMEGMEELQEASGELVDGTGELADGLEEFKTAMASYTDGVSKLNAGIKAIRTSLSAFTASGSNDSSVSDAATALTEDAKTLAQEMTNLQTSFAGIETFAKNVVIYKATVDEIVKGSNTALDSASALTENADSIATAQAQAQAQAVLEAAVDSDMVLSDEEKQQIKEAADYSSISITSGAGDATALIEGVQSGFSAVPDLEMPDLDIDIDPISEALEDMQKQMQVLSGLSDSMSGLSDGISTLNQALTQLETGASLLAGNNSQVMSGMQALLDGGDSLHEGMETFDAEGIQELAKMTDEDKKDLLKRVKALRKAEKQYHDSGNDKDTNYVIETDSVNEE